MKKPELLMMSEMFELLSRGGEFCGFPPSGSLDDATTWAVVDHLHREMGVYISLLQTSRGWFATFGYGWGVEGQNRNLAILNACLIMSRGKTVHEWDKLFLSDEGEDDYAPLGAHLVAAAPKLLALCEEAVGYVCGCGDWLPEDLRQRMLAAIRKAKGESSNGE